MKYANQQKYRELNKEKIAEKNRLYREANRDIILAKKKAYYAANKEKIKEYNNVNKDRKNATARLLRQTNPLVKLKHSCRTMLTKALNKNGYKKSSKTEVVLGCPYNHFKEYIESKFEPWMTWENYGKYNSTPEYGWDIDHIIPLSSALTETELLELNHYTNLQPLCSYVNRDIKRAN